jgi:helix-turn-helix protein
MPLNSDPIPALKREASVALAECLCYGNGDDLGALLSTDRFRIADLRRGRLGRFSLETLIRFLERAGMHVELRITRKPRASRTTPHTTPP